MPPPTRSGRPSAGGVKPIAERPGQPEAVALAELGEAVRARPDVLEDEADPTALDTAVGERAREPRALVRAGPQCSSAASM